MGERIGLAGLARVALAVFFMLAATARAGDGSAGLTVIATLFPQFDFARIVAGGRADVRLLLPPGAESHSYEPTPSDMKAIAAADLFLYTGDHMEPWARRLADAAAIGGAGGVDILDVARGITLRRDGDHSGDHDDPAEHDHDTGNGDHRGHGHRPRGQEQGEFLGDGHYHEFDPHIWLDPRLAAVMVENVAEAFIRRDPDGAAVYRHNADALIAELQALDAAFAARVAGLPRRTLVFGERFAFVYFFDRYGLQQVGAYTSCAPGAEPGLRAVLQVVRYVRDHDVRFIYLEAAATSRISDVIQGETGATILTVDSMHTPTAADLAAGVSYLSIMRKNMDAFARGLE
ncbi:MAG: zinc ABC transporter substrate-binding protein [Planctomycetes bacterium]|nr:zinc ABC transporter substrate-binding protein [Planctomycetota bacterium]